MQSVISSSVTNSSDHRKRITDDVTPQARARRCRSSATSVRTCGRTTAPRPSSSSTAPSTCRTCARRKCWSWRTVRTRASLPVRLVSLNHDDESLEEWHECDHKHWLSATPQNKHFCFLCVKNINLKNPLQVVKTSPKSISQSDASASFAQKLHNVPLYPQNILLDETEAMEPLHRVVKLKESCDVCSLSVREETRPSSSIGSRSVWNHKLHSLHLST